MNLEKLGKLKEVKDLRSIWPKEELDFTPWLAEQENLAILSEEIGIEMENATTEEGVGSFSADIVVKEYETLKKQKGEHCTDEQI